MSDSAHTGCTWPKCHSTATGKCTGLCGTSNPSPTATALAEAQSEIARLTARADRMEAALRGIVDGKPVFAYVQAGPGGIDFDAPGSPFDRGKAEGYEELQAIARAALTDKPDAGEG